MVATAEGTALVAGTAAAEGAAVVTVETVAFASGGGAIALKGGEDGCQLLVTFLDGHFQPVVKMLSGLRQTFET